MALTWGGDRKRQREGVLWMWAGVVLAPQPWPLICQAGVRTSYPSHWIQGFKGVLEMGFQRGTSQTPHTTSEDNNLSLPLTLWGLRTWSFLPREGMWPRLAEPRKSAEPTFPTPKLSGLGQAAFAMIDTGQRTNDHTSSWLPACVN